MDHAQTIQWMESIAVIAKNHPSQCALISGTVSISYEELETRSNQLAAWIQASGIVSEKFIGIGLPRCPELIIALLGILKSGAAYVPLDPSYPETRISQMIASADLKTVLTTPILATRFPNLRVIDVSKNFSNSIDAIGQINAQKPIYAIFTSGSTGQPKAASVFHSGFENLLAWYCSELSLGPEDRTLVISSPSFDLTQKNLFAPLRSGGTLVLDDCLTYDITRILSIVREHRITLINCTPSAFYPLVDASSGDDFKALASLRFAILGGEPISIPRLRTWLEHPNCRAEVVNSYGPTECTDICLFHRLHRGNLDDFPFVPLGREIPNVEVTIRDSNLAPLPDGEIGELCIGGVGLGGGYLYDPSRTAERFVNGSYRTGDLAKRLTCGTFEFRGRADYQVKVNGFRVELGEIEIALNSHDDVCEAVVTASSDKLTAHIQGTASTAELRSHLASRLPVYMIPSEFVSVEKFPLTPNGKIDRNALSAVPETISSLARPGTHSDLETTILQLWSKVLGSHVTDASANFFDLGGNSIHLAIIHVRLREIVGREFPITDLFANPTAQTIASHLSPNQTASAANTTQDRARLVKNSFARFQRPLNR
ncbi:MAG: non-ribosomal peptide synthetase [Gloeobacteraceae cyanobacterium ES-bin-144]|nr:non-ribosomal peptide synthetase [Verrucomicrobiales bacterium]